ncbi:uncharacterized protein LOC143898756 isoform X2 [Temnothorax americanus]|uniref:uncharacterized protein LOC143898756 isoform X2 n=1 Tax=Temnothorax americanus TaxID=1964332 RepID=UPI0040690379
MNSVVLRSVCWQLSKQMEHPEEYYYYKVNRFLLSVTGLCPYQSKWRARLIRAVLTVTMLITIVLLINSIFITSDITVDYMVDWIPAFLIVLIALSSLYTRVIHVDKFRELFERMSKDWALQKTHDEAKIMHEHAETARLFTLCCLSAAYIFVGIYIIWMFSSEVLDIISPMNESRPQRRPINIQFFIDDERYSYHVRTQISLALLVTTTIYVGCTGLFQTHAQHVCGMCELLGYRAERLFCVVKNEVACDLIQKSQISYGNIAIFVRQHCNIIRFVDIIETCNTIQFLIDLIGHIIMMSLTLIQMLTFSNFERAFRSVSVSIVGLCYMFMSCYMGQRIRDSSSSVCEKIFNCAWNNTVVPKQKALLIIMMRRYRPLILTGCKFYVMSLQNFGMISSMFTSEVTVDFIVDGIPSLLLIIGSLTNLYMRINHIDKFRELLERMSKDWALQKSHDEIKIMHEHAETSRLFTLYYLILTYMNIGGYNIWMFIPDILDTVSPMNDSRPRVRPFNAEFFIDEERYFHLIRIHISLVLLMLPVIYIASSTYFMTLTQHVCGMCELLGYRAERLFCVVRDEATCGLIEKSQISYGNMAVFVRQHYNIIQFVDIIETCHTVQFLMDLTGIVILMSLTLIQVLTISSFELAIRSVGVSITSLCYLFMVCYMGQRITDVSSSICDKIFKSTWYDAVVSEQKALLMIIMRRYHPLILTACKFYVMSLQNFGMVRKKYAYSARVITNGE